MKTKLLLLITFLSSFLSLQAQNNYITPNSIAGLTLQVVGNSGLTGQSKQAQSYASTTQNLWFTAPVGYDNTGTPQQYGDLNVYLRNTSNVWLKVSLYQGTTSNKIKEVNIPPLSQIDKVDFFNASDNFYWTIERTNPQQPIAQPDTFNVVRLASSNTIINVQLNDLNIGTGYYTRLKPNQNITTITLNGDYRNGEIYLYAQSNATNTSFKYQIMSPSDAVLAEGDVYVRIIEQTQYCILDIASLQLATGSKDQYTLITNSPNSSTTGPYNYTIKNLSTNTIVRSGQTPTPDVIYKNISFQNLPTASYEVNITAINKVCTATQTIYHVAASEACNIKVNYISKKGTSNTYEADVSFTDITTYKWESNYGINIGQGGQSGNKVQFTLPTNTPEGDYTFTVRNEGTKQCSNTSFFNHRNLQANTGSLETYVKFFTGKTDNWEIKGLSGEASGRDYTTQWRISDPRPNIIWQSYISDFQNLGQSAQAVAQVGFQKDTSRNDPAIWISAFQNRIELRHRPLKSGSVNILNTATDVTFPLWLRLEKIGNNIIAKYSQTQSLFPIWTQLGSINNATPGWTNLYKTLSVGSGKQDVTASARFQGHLGGAVNFGTTSTQTPTAPTIAKSIANPNQNDALTLTASVCSNGSIVKWYKNQNFVSAGNSLAIIAIHNDAYFARCENGSIRSDSSNVIRFIFGTNSCDALASVFAINSITATTANNYAVLFNAANLTSVNVDIKNSNNISVRNYDTPVAANPLIVDAGTLTTGTYTLKLTGKSCTGTAFKSFTINEAPPTLSCNNNGTFSISSISQSDGQLYNVTYNASNLTNVEAIVKNSSNVAVRTLTLAVAANPLIIDIGNQSAGTYTLQLNGLSCIGSTTAKTFTVTNNNPSCQNGGTFSLTSATYAAANLTFQFNATNLYNATWTVRQGSSIISTGILANISNSTNTVTVLTLSAGTYTLQLEGNSCIGVAVRQFTVGTVTTTPILSSSITTPSTGDNITLTATGCTANYNFYKNLEINPFATTTGTIQISNIQAPDYYYVQCASGSLNSNYIQVSAPTTNGGGTGQTNFVNNTKSAPYESILGKYNPDAFPTISVTNTIDPKLNRTYPNWAIGWKVEGANFTNATRNKKTQNLGIAFMYDIKQQAYNGYGEHCVDYVNEQDPNTGQAWANDIDTYCTGTQYNANFNNLTHTYQNFQSAIPFELRAGNGFGTTDVARWDNATLASGLHYDDGQKGGSVWFGMRDWVNSKANVGLTDSDIETNHEAGQDGTNKHLAFLLGLGSKVQGYAFSQYSSPLSTVYIDPSKYPTNSQSPTSTYPTNTQLIDGTDGEPNSGSSGIRANQIPSSNDWNLTNKISITARFSGQKGIADVPNVIPCIEIASYASATFPHGADFYYDSSDTTLHRTINKFGLNANADHVIARVIFSGETNKWYTDNKLDGRKVILQSKITCDAGTFGTLSYANGGPNKYHNKVSLRFAHFGREYAFDIGGFTAFTGCEWNIWDRNDQGHNLDGYHGAFGLINLLYQRKTFGSESKSFVDLKPTAKFLLWDSEISYDNGTTFIKEKANKYVMNQGSIPQRQFITPDGYWGGFLARPENTEATTCILRVTYNGQVYTHTVSVNMWETVDYEYRNTTLANLPNDKKDYYYFLIKLGGIIQNGGQVNAPVINSSPSPVVANTSTTFTATGCTGTVKWYLSDAQVSTGTTYTVSSPIANNTYTATCTINSVASSASNTITVTATSNSGAVTITEPNKSQYYFSDGHAPSYYASGTNLPAIISHNSPAYYDEANECVTISNANVKYVINLRRGGHINGAYRIGNTFNYVYNGYDGGFQVGGDFHQKPDRNYSQGGKNSANSPDDTGYNVTHGGTYTNGNGISYTPTLIDYHPVGTNGYYIKFRPLFYTLNPGEFAKNYIEVTYTLIGDVLKADYVYSSFRDDGQIDTSFGFVGQSVPACFLNNQLTKFKSYTGSSPWSNGSLTDVIIPTSGVCATPGTSVSPEHWGFAYNPTTNLGFGVMNLTHLSDDAGIVYKQCEVNSSNTTGTEFLGGFTYISPTLSMPNFSSGTFTFNTTAFMMVGTDTDVRTQFKTISGN